MANDKAFKIKNGLSAKRYLQSSTAVAASDVDMSLGSYFTKTLSANTTFTFSNPPASGTAGSFALEVTGADVTVAYDLANASYDSKSFSVGSQATAPRSLHLISSGTKMYTMSGGTVYQYTLSTAYDVSTASYDSKSFSTTSQDGSPIGFGMKPDGTKLYMIGFSSDTVYQYTLSTAYDISTASYDSKSFNVGSQAPVAVAVSFKTDGTKMFIAGNSNDAIYQYTLSTAWDVSTASYDSVSLDISAEQADVSGMQFSSDGTVIFIVSSADIDKYTLSTAWDISTATASSLFSTSSQDTTLRGVAFNADGTKTYVAGDDNNTIYQYSTGSTVTTGSFDLSTGNYFTDTPSADVEYTFSNPADVQSFQLEVTGGAEGYDLANASYDSVELSVSAQEGSPNSIFFKPDGTKLFLMGDAGDDVNEYALSTAWDITSATFTTNFSVSSQETGPHGLWFKPDGTKMYVIGTAGDDVNEYSLSTAWDVSSASYSQNFSVSNEDTVPRAVTFKPDGTKMFMVGTLTDKIHEYTLSTAWDISTATYVDGTTLTNSTNPYATVFNDDGTKLFTMNNGGDSVLEYSLTTAYDASTLSYVRSFSLSSQDTNPKGLFFKPDGYKMFVSGLQNDKVYQYRVATPVTITWSSAIQWAGGTAPTSPALDEKDLYTFMTDDTGTSYIGFQSGDAFQ